MFLHRSNIIFLLKAVDMNLDLSAVLGNMRSKRYLYSRILIIVTLSMFMYIYNDFISTTYILVYDTGHY